MLFRDPMREGRGERFARISYGTQFVIRPRQSKRQSKRPPYNVPPATFENDKVLERKRKSDKVLERVAFSERRGFGFGFGFRTQQCLYILYLQTGSKRNPAEPTNFNGETLGAKKPLRRWNSKPFRFPLMILTPRNHP